MSNLGLWGKTHVLLPCGFLPLLFVTLFVSSNLVNLFNDLLGGWEVMAAGGWAVIAFGSGVAGLSVLCPHTHSTHDLPLTPLHRCQFTFMAASVDAHADQWAVHAHA